MLGGSATRGTPGDAVQQAFEEVDQDDVARAVGDLGRRLVHRAHQDQRKRSRAVPRGSGRAQAELVHRIGSGHRRQRDGVAPVGLDRFGSLVGGLTDAQWGMSTRCEGWTVGDVAAHLVGTMAGIAAGRLDGLGTPEVTQREVDERKGRTPADLAGECGEIPDGQGAAHQFVLAATGRVAGMQVVPNIYA
jgi:hypothetical protein